MAIFAQLMGSAFRPKEVRDYLLTLSIGTSLQLERDPENQFDANAIRVLDDAIFLGHLERQTAAELAPRMDEGEHFSARIKRVDDPKKPLLEIIPG